MRTVILSGGKGVRYSSDKPKALAMIGDKPIIHHLMDFYVKQGFNDFIVCLGWKYEDIIKYFKNISHEFNIEFVDTGQDSHTAKRLKLIEECIPENDENFLCNYCDALSNIDLTKLQVRHLTHKNIATLSAIRPTNQFGELIFDENDNVIRFEEKPKLHNYVNGGFFIFNRKIFKYIDKDKNQELEKDILTNLADNNELGAYKHNNFWKTINNPKDEISFNIIYEQCMKQNELPIWLKI